MVTFYAVQLKDVSRGSRGQDVKVLQALLNGSGFSCGTCDGIFGVKTLDALLKFQKAVGLPAKDSVDMNTWNKLFNY